jgi:hypothetical protein
MMSAGVYFHCGTDNIASNNIIADVDTDLKGVITSCNKGGNPTWPNIIKGFDWRSNIIYFPNGTTIGFE